ncbi:MAG: short-chain dehydrogenase, partial [Bdellovibrio sp. CG10_big_fil_rev_8_21_14_0_10_47_8]
MEIKNHHIVITGANRGIGRAVSQMCAEHGGNLHLVMRKEDLELKEELLKSGAASVDIYIADLSQPTEINQLLKRLEPVPVDILFNNAGQLTGGLLEEQPIDQIYSMLMVNVNALIHLTHGLLPGMLRRNRGKIINNSSVSGVMHFPCATTYSASKAAVIAFTNCLRAELGETKVTTLLLITPGVDTRMYQEIPKLYGKNMDLGFLSGMSPKKYAEIIREAILEDLEILKPQGL